METMDADETSRQRLARLMDARRAALRLTWYEVAEQAGITREGLRRTRVGTGRIRSLTKRGIEDALRWAPGSVDAILDGGRPMPASAPRSVVEEKLSAALRDHEAEREDEFERLDRLYEEWKKDPARGRVLRELLETWGERDAG